MAKETEETEVLQQPKTEPAKTEPAKVETKTTPAPETPAPKTTERKVVRLAEGDDIPDDADLLELSKPALMKRLTRHTSAQLKERFGTADFDDIKKRLDRAAELEAAEEARAREAMTERERLEADLDKERRLRTDAERRYARAVEDRVVDKQENRITSIAAEVVDPDYVDVLLPKLAKYLKDNYSDDELRALKDRDLKKWFEEQVEKKPKLAKDFEAKPKKEVKKVPLNNGARQDKPSGQQSGQSSKKSFSPNAENAMTSAEARAEARKQGFQW